MVSMAVIASRDLGGDVRLAQGHGLAVVGLAIMLKAVLVASAANLIAGHLKVAVLGRLNLVRRMAVGANRPAHVALGQELAVDALVVGLLDADMAFAAGLGHVGAVDGGIPIHCAFDVMHPWQSLHEGATINPS